MKRLLILAILVVSPSLFGQFAFDDKIHITDSVEIREISNLPSFFTQPTFPGNLYRPIPTTSYALTYHFFELDPLPYHITNILLHALVCLSVFKLFSTINSEIALLAGVLYATHPLNIEAVANICGRTELFAALFGLAAMFLYLRGVLRPSILNLFGLAAVFLLALLSKESSATFLLLAPLFAIATKPSMPGSLLAALSRPSFTMLGSFCVYMLLRFNALGNLLSGSTKISFLDNPLVGVGSLERAINALNLLGKYIALAIMPGILSADYSYAQLAPLLSYFTVEVVLNFYLVALVLVFCFWRGQRKAEIRLFSRWFFLAFLVTSNLFFPIGTIFAERLTYVPLIGLVGLLAIGIQSIDSVILRRLITFLPIGFFIVRATFQCIVWTSNHTLFEWQSLVSPKSAKTMVNRSVSLIAQGKLDEASLLSREALSVYPAYPEAAHNIAVVYLEKKMEKAARHWFKRALKIKSDYYAAENALGRLDLQDGKIESARRAFENVLANSPSNFDARVGMIAVLIVEGKFEQATSELSLLTKLAPSNHDLAILSTELRSRQKVPSSLEGNDR